MNHTVYYAPDAIGSPANLFTDGTFVYSRVHGLGSIGALDGWLKRIGKKIGKGIKKVAKGAVKVVKKVHKATMKVVRKALPIVNTALTFIPGVGWAAKAALTAAEMGLKAIDKAKAKKKARKNAIAKAKLSLVTKVNALNKQKTFQDKPSLTNPVNNSPKTTPKARPIAMPTYSAIDFMRVNAAVQKDRIGVNDVVNLVQQQVNQYQMR